MRWNDWTGLDWNDWTGLDWTGLDWTNGGGGMTGLGYRLACCFCLFALESDFQLHMSMTGESIDQFVEKEETDNDIHGSGTAK
jgi:hypothetical protein